MSDTLAPRPIVVGVDGSVSGERALDWATQEATARGLPLRIVHAHESSPFIGAAVMVAPPQWDDQDWVTETARERVATLAPRLEVSTEEMASPAFSALEDASEQADTVVVGARGRGAVRRALLGSTSLHVAAHASCPVVVVPAIEHKDAALFPVLVGVDGSPLSLDALGYAFAAAAQRKAPLDVVICWDTKTLPTYRLSGAIAKDVEAAAVRHHRDVAEEAAAPWREKYPQVAVTVHVSSDSPAEVLVERSRASVLTVVGSRGHGGFTGALLGSVSDGVLHRAHSPVAVVRSS